MPDFETLQGDLSADEHTAQMVRRIVEGPIQGMIIKLTEEYGWDNARLLMYEVADWLRDEMDRSISE